jgi:hypothetical protein
MSSAEWEILCYDFYCSIIITSCDLVHLYYVWKREDRIPDILHKVAYTHFVKAQALGLLKKGTAIKRK